MISKSREDNDALFDKLNGLHEAISFTKEEESENLLIYYDAGGFGANLQLNQVSKEKINLVAVLRSN